MQGVMYEKIMYVQKTKSALLQATWRRKSKGGGEICMEKEFQRDVPTKGRVCGKEAFPQRIAMIAL